MPQCGKKKKRICAAFVCVNINTETWCKYKYVPYRDVVATAVFGRVYLQCDWTCFAMWTWPSYTEVSMSAQDTWTDTCDHTWAQTLWYSYLLWIRPGNTAGWKELFQYPAHLPQLFTVPPHIISLPPSLAWWSVLCHPSIFFCPIFPQIIYSLSIFIQELFFF